jgi:hypothetical protein
MDFLGLRTLTVLEDAVRFVRESAGKAIDLPSLPLDDADVSKNNTHARPSTAVVRSMMSAPSLRVLSINESTYYPAGRSSFFVSLFDPSVAIYEVHNSGWAYNFGFVIDAGLARLSRYNPRTRTRRLPIEPISQSSANQRKGRAGRARERVSPPSDAARNLRGRPQVVPGRHVNRFHREAWHRRGAAGVRHRPDRRRGPACQ